MKALTLSYLWLGVWVTAAVAVQALCDGCAHVQTVALTDLPNLSCVDSNRNVWRCGQPTAAGFAKLAAIGVTNVVKLNEKSEGVDVVPLNNLYYRPITLEEQLGLAQLWQARLDADWTIFIKPGTVVHCTHGEDRTGLVVAMYRVRVQGWSKAAAEQEMLAHGFHRELLGLWHAWEEFGEKGN